MWCVIAPTPRTGEGPRTDCYDREFIKKAYMEKGTRSFSQTESTPFMQPDFVARVVYHTKLPGADEIPAGTFMPSPDMDPYAIQFLEQLKSQDSVKGEALSKAISTKEYQESWKRMYLNTSSLKQPVWAYLCRLHCRKPWQQDCRVWRDHGQHSICKRLHTKSLDPNDRCIDGRKPALLTRLSYCGTQQQKWSPVIYEWIASVRRLGSVEGRNTTITPINTDCT